MQGRHEHGGQADGLRGQHSLIRRRVRGHRGAVHVISDSPGVVVAQFAAFAPAGVRHMQRNFLDVPRTESLDRFVEGVLPHVERAGTSRHTAVFADKVIRFPGRLHDPAVVMHASSPGRPRVYSPADGHSG
jgi:hypothetical protein